MRFCNSIVGRIGGNRAKRAPLRLLCLALFTVPACADEDGEGQDDAHSDEGHGHDHDGETEIISKVELTFTPDGGGAAVVASFTDPDGDGGVSGVSERIELSVGTQYVLGVRLLNELEDPAEDITEEVREEAEDHLFLIAGEGVQGPASASTGALVSHTYDDLESDYGDNAVGEDLPVGLSSIVVANAAGESKLRVILRHLPELNGTPQKRAGLPEGFANGDSLPGDVDVDVTFVLSVE